MSISSPGPASTDLWALLFYVDFRLQFFSHESRQSLLKGPPTVSFLASGSINSDFFICDSPTLFLRQRFVRIRQFSTVRVFSGSYYDPIAQSFTFFYCHGLSVYSPLRSFLGQLLGQLQEVPPLTSHRPGTRITPKWCFPSVPLISAQISLGEGGFS